MGKEGRGRRQKGGVVINLPHTTTIILILILSADAGRCLSAVCLLATTATTTSQTYHELFRQVPQENDLWPC